MSAPITVPTGSSWDVATGPEGTDRRHLTEWIKGSAIHPDLAAANLQSLQGAEVIEALVGDRIEQLGAHAKQYATRPLARLLAPLEPVAAAGGWWCSGLDPLADWRALMAWGCFKPDAPQIDPAKGFSKPAKVRKYEHPTGTSARSFWLKVPAVVGQLIADRHGLALTAEVAADATGADGAFWRWWASTPALPLLITEGAKKAAALLSAGVPAVALPGIWNGAPKGPNGRPALLIDLAAVPLEGRPVSVLFDGSARRNPDEPKAARRLGRLLEKAGAKVLVGTVPGSRGKGLDDHLASGGSWEQLAKALKPISPEPVLPRLRRPDRLAPADQWLGDACPIPSPEQAPLVALVAPMGAGKTEAIAAAVAPLLAVGKRVVLITHRRSLGAALAERLGLPWGDEARPGSDLRQQGIALCIDSLVAGSAVRFRPADWAGAVVVIDEVAQVLAHALFATGTAISKRRAEALANLAAMLANAAQVLVADAQLSAPVLAAMETATGRRALLIGSAHQPAAGRQLINHKTRNSWRHELVTQLQAHRRLWISTTAQKAGCDNSAQSLEKLALENWPDARVLRVDSETVADPGYDAHRLAADPNGIASQYDVVVASPAVAAGLSVDQLPGHFTAVFACSGGTTEPEAIAQAVARVRDNCTRHLYAPERSPGNALRVGCGSFEPQQLLQQQAQHGAAIVAQLAGSIDLETGSAGPWLPLWAKLAAATNRKAQAYRATVLGLLEREGYEISAAAALSCEAAADAQLIGAQLKAIAADGQAAADATVQAAELLSDQQATELQKYRRRLQPAEKAQLARWRIAKAWGLGRAAPTTELLEADREQRSQRGRFGWALQSLEARQLVARHDQQTAQQLAPNGTAWTPDLCRELIGPKLAAADALGLPGWLSRGNWFSADDAQLIALQSTAEAHRGSLIQVLGISTAKTGTGTLRRLLRLAGYRLEAHRSRIDGERDWRYRVVSEPLPDGVSSQQLERAWTDQLSQKIPYMNKGNWT